MEPKPEQRILADAVATEEIRIGGVERSDGIALEHPTTHILGDPDPGTEHPAVGADVEEFAAVVLTQRDRDPHAGSDERARPICDHLPRPQRRCAEHAHPETDERIAKARSYRTCIVPLERAAPFGVHERHHGRQSSRQSEDIKRSRVDGGDRVDAGFGAFEEEGLIQQHVAARVYVGQDGEIHAHRCRRQQARLQVLRPKLGGSADDQQGYRQCSADSTSLALAVQHEGLLITDMAADRQADSRDGCAGRRN